MKKIFKFLFLILFFFSGLSLAFIRSQKKAQNKEKINSQTEEAEEINWPVPAGSELEVNAYFSNMSEDGSDKFTIVQNQEIKTDKIQAQTGDQVHFSTKIKNQGAEMKHLTHLCFNHSGGVTFGCLNGPSGPNLDPGKEMEISSTTVFTIPGTYYVWLTWSQDETNFYQPKTGNRVKVVIK